MFVSQRAFDIVCVFRFFLQEPWITISPNPKFSFQPTFWRREDLIQVETSEHRQSRSAKKMVWCCCYRSSRDDVEVKQAMHQNDCDPWRFVSFENFRNLSSTGPSVVPEETFYPRVCFDGLELGGFRNVLQRFENVGIDSGEIWWRWEVYILSIYKLQLLSEDLTGRGGERVDGNLPMRKHLRGDLVPENGVPIRIHPPKNSGG